MKVLESGENYLEKILLLEEKLHRIRSLDIANAMGFTKASVSVAMKHLREDDYIAMDDGGFITLTEKGKKVAEKMYERHEIIARALIIMGVEKDTAYIDACKIEHDISEESFLCLKKFCESGYN